MGGLFGGAKVPAPTPVAATTPAPTSTDPSVVAAQDAALRNQAQAQGAASTILTSGQGTGAPTTSRKTLLGAS